MSVFGYLPSPCNPYMARGNATYLRTCRRRCGLSQREVAILLGARSGAKVSRYERVARKPNLESAFACQVIFDVPAHEIFPGVFAAVEQSVIKQARLLSKELTDIDRNRHAAEKLEVLSRIIERGADESRFGI